jgi:hypothetical protein
MLREFMKEVKEIQRDLRCGAQFLRCLPSEPLADNERRVGIITDSWTKALYIAFQKRCIAVNSLTHAEMINMDPERLFLMANEVSALTAIVFAELQSNFGSHIIGVRRNWVVAELTGPPKPKQKQKPKRRKAL